MIIHSASQSVILKAVDPFAIRSLLPKHSKTIDVAGYNIAVKHTVDSTRLLRNLGYSVPSPILTDYKWPGKHTPFDHQQVMADMMTVHPKVFNLSEMGCVSGDTEYLSPTGWRRIDQYTKGQVAQYHPTTGAIEFVDAEYVKLPCSLMIRFKTTRGIDQLLSPEHRVLLADGRVVTAEEVYQRYGTQDIFNRTLKFRTTFNAPEGIGMPLTDEQIRVQIAANADGWFQARRVYIRLKRTRKIERLRALLKSAAIQFWERPCAPDGFVKFSFEPPMAKGFTSAWWMASPHQLKIIAEEVIHWDGSYAIEPRNIRFTGTRQDADYVQYVWATQGLRASLRVDPRSPDVVSITASRAILPGLYGHDASGSARRNVWLEPSPDGFKYCFRVPSTFLVLRRAGNIVATGNTGKTYASLWAADWLMHQGLVHKALILAPLSTLDTVWKQDIFDILMHRTVNVLHGSLERRMERLAMDVDFYILNHDGISITKLAKEIHRRKDIDLVILDEASMFRNASTTKWRFLKWVIENKPRLWQVTGTPCPNEPTDAWALAKLANPNRGPQYFGQFKRQTMMQVSTHKWVPKAGAIEAAYHLMQPAVRFKKADCLTLPPVVTLNRQTRLTKAQRDAYEQMREQMILDAQAGPISAVNAADQINKLRQILCLAGGTQVLTDRGWVAIELVQLSDLVWDGVEWVGHTGVVDNGVQRVIQSDGVWMTPDHSILTVRGWRTAHEQSSDRIDRVAVRPPDSDTSRRNDDGEHPESHLVMSVRLRRQGMSRKSELTQHKTPKRQSLRMQGNSTTTTWDEQQTPLSNLGTHEASLLRSYVQGLQKLGRKGHSHVRSMVHQIRQFLVGHVQWILGSVINRSDRQRWSLRADKLSLGDCQTTSSQSTATTYDITNCGPRHRFVVQAQGSDLMIVHNCGVIKHPDTGTYSTIDHRYRVADLIDTIDEASAKVIVIVPFKGIINELAIELEKRYTVGLLNGDVSAGARTKIIQAFKTQPDPHVLLCHPKVMAHGLNLTEADTTIFYAPIYSGDEYQQVIERFNRTGQTRHMSIVRLAAHPLEWDIYKAVDNRQITQSTILDLYKSVTE